MLGRRLEPDEQEGDNSHERITRRGLLSPNYSVLASHMLTARIMYIEPLKVKRY